MDSREKAALRANHLALIDDLDAKDIAPVLFQDFMIDDEQYEEIIESNLTRRKLCASFLLMIKKPSSKCTFEGLLHALKYNNAYTFLADKLVSSIKKTGPPAVENDERDGAQEHDDDNRVIILEPVRKVDVFTSTRKKMSRLAHELKRLSHDGQAEKFGKVTGLIHKKFMKQKLNLNLPVGQKMELADMRFTALEAEASAKRVKYDFSLCETDAFKEMMEVIPFTSNPRVSSMTYLARFGSSVGMSEGTDPGLAYLQYAKQHSEYVTPCKDTGMVYYIEVNLLSQKYEIGPSDDLKHRVLQTTQYAMSQFESESEEVKNDYQRMLMLKMVYCYLGLGLFCKRIQKVQTTRNDIEAAKNCLDFIEKPEIWTGLEKRRKMLFLMAKSEYYRQIGTSDLATIHAKESRKLARENGWKAELPNIENIVKELEERKPETQTGVEDDFVQNLIDDLIDEDSDGDDGNAPENTPVKMDTLKEGAFNDAHSVTTNPSQVGLMEPLKSYQNQTNDDCTVNTTNVNNAASSYAYRMDVLKEHSDVYKMNTLTEKISDRHSNLDHVSILENNRFRLAMPQERVFHDDSVATYPSNADYMDQLKNLSELTDDVCKMNTLKDANAGTDIDDHRMLKENNVKCGCNSKSRKAETCQKDFSNNDFSKMKTLKYNISDTNNNLNHVSFPEKTRFSMHTLKERGFDAHFAATNPSETDYKLSRLNTLKHINSDTERFDRRMCSSTENFVKCDRTSSVEGAGVCQIGSQLSVTGIRKMDTLTNNYCDVENFGTRMCLLNEHCMTGTNGSIAAASKGCSTDEFKGLSYANTDLYDVKSHKKDVSRTQSPDAKMNVLKDKCIIEANNLAVSNADFLKMNSIKDNTSESEMFGGGAIMDNLKVNGIMEENNLTLRKPDGCPTNELQLSHVSHSPTDWCKIDYLKEHNCRTQRDGRMGNLEENCLRDNNNSHAIVPQDFQMDMLKSVSL